MKKKIHLSSRIFLINKKYKTNEFYHYIKDPNNVITIPILKNKKFVLVYQKREPINKKIYEFPMGWIDKGEKPINSAVRELLEETGYRSLSVPKKLLILYPDPGRLSKNIVCYYADKIIKIGKPEKGIKIIYCNKKKVIELIKRNKFNSAAHISAFYHYLLKKKHVAHKK